MVPVRLALAAGRRAGGGAALRPQLRRLISIGDQLIKKGDWRRAVSGALRHFERFRDLPSTTRLCLLRNREGTSTPKKPSARKISIALQLHTRRALHIRY